MTHLALRPELDRLRCSNPDCDCDDELVLNCSECNAPVWAIYSKGELQLECAECERPILSIPVGG